MKVNFNKRIDILIEVLNTKINLWRQEFYAINLKEEIAKNLDIYINKILWKLAKRIHPRRPNTWIYNKYWKFIFGSWRFCLINEKGKTISLIPHQGNNFLNLKDNLSNSLINREIKDLRKVLLIFFTHYKQKNSGIKFIIYKKQKGLCYKCKFPLNESGKKLIRIKNQISAKRNYIYSELLILTHSSCVI